MWTATVVTHWTVANGTNVPVLASLLRPGDSAEDITGQPDVISELNLVVWRVTCAAATLDAIAADPNHTVLTAEEVDNANP